MKKIIEEIKDGVKRVTTVDERFYIRPTTNKETGLPEYEFIPSVTWIAGSYPKGIGFYKWLANQSWDESQATLQAAGDKGSKAHYAIASLLEGKEVSMYDQYINPSTEKPEELTLEEYECLMAYALWFNDTKPEILAYEFTVFNDEDKYAGTVDLLAKIGEQLYIIDNKTGQYVWPEHELQLSAYKHAIKAKLAELSVPEGEVKLAILQLGYKRNQKGYKFTEIQDKYDLFLNAKAIWANEHSEEKPSQKDYPLSLQIIKKVEEIKKEIIKTKTKK